MNELDLFQLSLTKKSPQFLKSGGYHFKVPERVTGQWAELTAKYGEHVMEEDNLSFAPADKAAVHNTLMVERRLPDFGRAVADADYTDGCRLNFADGSFLICRFSGTEPLLRIFAEDKTSAGARSLIDTMRTFLHL